MPDIWTDGELKKLLGIYELNISTITKIKFIKKNDKDVWLGYNAFVGWKPFHESYLKNIPTTIINRAKHELNDAIIVTCGSKVVNI